MPRSYIILAEHPGDIIRIALHETQRRLGEPASLRFLRPGASSHAGPRAGRPAFGGHSDIPGAVAWCVS
jgi:hypothetical protein